MARAKRRQPWPHAQHFGEPSTDYRSLATYSHITYILQKRADQLSVPAWHRNAAEPGQRSSLKRRFVASEGTPSAISETAAQPQGRITSQFKVHTYLPLIVECAGLSTRRQGPCSAFLVHLVGHSCLPGTARMLLLSLEKRRSLIQMNLSSIVAAYVAHRRELNCSISHAVISHCRGLCVTKSHLRKLMDTLDV